MTNTTNRGSGPNPQETMSLTVTADEIVTEKVVTQQPDESVTVTFTIRSTRADPSEIRLIDRLSPPLRDNAVEFHPDYDPVHWTRANEAVVYETTIAAGAERTTAYRHPVDGSINPELFATEPTLEVGEFDGIFGYWTDDEQRTRTDLETPGADSPEVPNDQSGDQLDNGEAPAARDQHQAQMVAEPEPDNVATGDLEKQLQSLRADVAALQEAIEAGDPSTADVGHTDSQLTARLDTVDVRLESITASLDELRSEVEQGARWRALVQESFEFDPAAK